MDLPERSHCPGAFGSTKSLIAFFFVILSTRSSSSACCSVAIVTCACSPALSASEQALDHNQDRQTILSETQNRACMLSKEILNLKDEKTKQVSSLICQQFKLDG